MPICDDGEAERETLFACFIISVRRNCFRNFGPVLIVDSWDPVTPTNYVKTALNFGLRLRHHPSGRVWPMRHRGRFLLNGT